MTSNTVVNQPSRVSLLQRIALSFGTIPTNLGWAFSEALIIPYLLEVGCPLYACSWAWVLSPVLSEILKKYVNNIMSKWEGENQCGWRGRKDLICIFSVISAVFMFLLPESHTIAKFFQDNHTWLTVILVIIFFTIMDLSHYLLEIPVKTLSWEIAWGEEAIYGEIMSTYTIIKDASRLLGYGIICIWLEWDVFGNKLSHIKAIFTLGSAIVIVSMLFSVFVSPNPREFESQVGDSTQRFAKNIHVFENDDNPDVMDPEEVRQLIEPMQIDNDGVGGQNQSSTRNPKWGFYFFFLSQLAGWITICSVQFFWTSYIAVDIYKGVPTNHWQNRDFKRFENGIIFGALGLLFMQMFMLLASLFYNKLQEITNIRALYLFTEFLMGILCILFFLISRKLILIICVAIFGIGADLHLKCCSTIITKKLPNMYKQIQRSQSNVLKHIVNHSYIIAPVIVSLFGGPIAYAFNSNFSYVFLFPGAIVILLNIIVGLMFMEIIPIKLPTDEQL